MIETEGRTSRQGGNISQLQPMINIIMADGSRHFGELPQTVLWYDLRDHIEKLEGALITGFLTDHVTEAWIDFSYRDHEFSVNDQMGNYWFFVKDPKCPDGILTAVLSHCSSVLKSRSVTEDS